MQYIKNKTSMPNVIKLLNLSQNIQNILRRRKRAARD